MTNNPYQVLGVSPGASEETIRQAYRELVRKYHPDQFPDARAKELAEVKMREINAAYDAITLGNQQEATQAGWTHQQTPQQPPYQGPFYGHPNQSPYYRSRGTGSGSCCQTLTCLCCADSCCECLGGDLCLCC